MIVYHGTTARRARRICLEGFLPRKPSRRVWFAKSKGYAEGRARTQARRAHDRPVVLTCNIDLSGLKSRLAKRRFFRRGGNIAIAAPIPATVLRSVPGVQTPTTPDELVRWLNRLLGLRPHKGVSRKHPGVDRLSRWIVNRMTSQPHGKIHPSELLHLAKQWLGEFFRDADIDPDRLLVRRRPATIHVKAELPPPAPQPDPREEEALELLEDPKPRRRVRGLGLLAELGDPDLFDFCAMFLDDDSPDVRVAALKTMLRCEDGHPEPIVPLAGAEDKRIRAAAIAALARHAGGDAPRWFERGLKDPEPCVRLAAAAVLEHLNPARHRRIFELALYDPNPQVAHLAEKLTAGKGFHREG